MAIIPPLPHNSVNTADPKPEDKSDGMKGDAAKVKGTVIKEWLGVVRAEERTRLLRSLLMVELGTREVENFIMK